MNGSVGRFDDVVGWGFHLVAHGVDPATLLDDEQRAFFDAIGGKLVGVSGEEEDGLALDITWTYERYFAAEGMAAFIMRPDFYLFGTVASLDEVPAMIDALREQLGVGSTALATT